MPEAVTCVIVGGGGHARVLIDALAESGTLHRLAVVDADAARWGALLLDVPIVGGDEQLAPLAAAGATYFVIGLGGASDNAPRRRLYENALALGLTPLAVVHPRATISRWARIESGAQIIAGAIINANAVLGTGVIVNSGAIVEHDCRIGDFVHVATGARLTSGVVVGAGAHIGAGATVRQLVTIGANAIVGAGAVVVRDVVAGQTVVGVPAASLERRAEPVATGR